MVDIQSDLVRGVLNRLTIPLTHVWVEAPTERLAPPVQVEGTALFLDTLGVLAFPANDLRNSAGNLRSEAPRIWSAIDYALHGY